MTHPEGLTVEKEEALGIFSLSPQLFQTCLNFDTLTVPSQVQKGESGSCFPWNQCYLLTQQPSNIGTYLAFVLTRDPGLIPYTPRQQVSKRNLMFPLRVFPKSEQGRGKIQTLGSQRS